MLLAWSSAGGRVLSAQAAIPHRPAETAAAQAEVANLSLMLKEASDDPRSSDVVHLVADVLPRWASFTWRFGVDPAMASSGSDLGSQAERLLAAPELPSLHDTADEPYANSHRRLWRVLLLDMSGRLAEARDLLADMPRDHWSAIRYGPYETEGNSRYAWLRASLADRAGDAAAALRWHLEACLDGDWTGYSLGSLQWSCCAQLLSAAGRTEDAETLWGAAAGLLPDSDGAALARAELQRRGAAGVIEGAYAVVLQLSPDDRSSRTFVIGRHGAPERCRTLAARLAAPAPYVAGPVVCFGDASFAEQVRPMLSELLADHDIPLVSSALVSLRGLGDDCGRFAAPLLFRLERAGEVHFRDWKHKGDLTDPDAALRALFGDGPVVRPYLDPVTRRATLGGAELARAWRDWLTEQSRSR